MKYVLIAAGVLVAALLAVFLSGGLFDESAPDDPKLRELSQLVTLAERTCLSNTREEQSASLKISLEAISTQLRADSGVARKREAVRGAAAALPEAVKKLENDDIRKCMEPWSEKIRALATAQP